MIRVSASVTTSSTQGVKSKTVFFMEKDKIYLQLNTFVKPVSSHCQNITLYGTIGIDVFTLLRISGDTGPKNCLFRSFFMKSKFYLDN